MPKLGSRSIGVSSNTALPIGSNSGGRLLRGPTASRQSQNSPW